MDYGYEVFAFVGKHTHSMIVFVGCVCVCLSVFECLIVCVCVCIHAVLVTLASHQRQLITRKTTQQFLGHMVISVSHH
jgi:hypothetical protein